MNLNFRTHKIEIIIVSTGWNIVRAKYMVVIVAANLFKYECICFPCAFPLVLVSDSSGMLRKDDWRAFSDRHEGVGNVKGDQQGRGSSYHLFV